MSLTPARCVALAAIIAVPLVSAGCTSQHYFDQQRIIRGPQEIVEAPSPAPEDVRRLPMYNEFGAPMGWDDLMNAIAWADVIVIGEQHDDGVGHAFQRAVVEDTLNRWRPSALSMEMLERDEQPLVEDYFEGIISARQFTRLTFSESWGGEGKWDEWYLPIIDAAKDADGRVVAANAPRRYVRLARTDGWGRLDALPAHRRQWVEHPDRLPGGRYRERFWEVMSIASRPEAAPPKETPTEESVETDETVEEVSADAAETEAAPDTESLDAPADDAPAETEPPASQPESTEPAPAPAPESEIEPPASQPESTEPAPDAEGDEQEPEHASDEAAPPAEDETPAPADEAEGGEAEGDEDEEAAPPAMAHVLTDADIEALFSSQSVWDATMAGSIARAKRSGARKVVHLVGQFHSDFEGGTIIQLRKLLPTAKILVISMQREWPEGFLEEDLGRADVIVYTGARPPEPEEIDEGEEDGTEEDAEETPDATAEEGEHETPDAEAEAPSDEASTPEPPASQPATQDPPKDAPD